MPDACLVTEDSCRAIASQVAGLDLFKCPANPRAIDAGDIVWTEDTKPAEVCVTAATGVTSVNWLSNPASVPVATNQPTVTIVNTDTCRPMQLWYIIHANVGLGSTLNTSLSTTSRVVGGFNGASATIGGVFDTAVTHNDAGSPVTLVANDTAPSFCGHGPVVGRGGTATFSFRLETTRRPTTLSTFVARTDMVAAVMILGRSL